MVLTLATLHEHCLARPILTLPSRDVLGVRNGPGYQHDLFKSLHKYRYGCGGLTGDLVGGRPYAFMGNKWPGIDMLLKLNPYIFQVRCNYPVFLPKTAIPKRRTSRAGEPSLILVDRMLTVALNEKRDQAHLHALFLRKDPLVKAQAWLEPFGVSVERISLEQFSPIAIRNAAQCYQWLHGSDIRIWENEAKVFAAELLRTQGSRQARALSLDARMARMAENLRCDLNHAYRLLGTAIAYGFVAVEPSACLSIHRPLKLLFEER
ncbi:hypothetical protein [Cupriavidus taiwanensis]|uniref:hypothetical protein n=1 Tax=Cupriavidus taiwanensis TaxID=164546 RepID=UPI000E11BC31|nr:hypothetical protein [Cupriavidus taiwanensis]SOY70956.1 hypothetical protein CBM2585_B50176 [Cupriavidus taiwanensis]